jgi:hypothetical protein
MTSAEGMFWGGSGAALAAHLREFAAERQVAMHGDGLDIIGERARPTKEHAESRI